MEMILTPLMTGQGNVQLNSICKKIFKGLQGVTTYFYFLLNLKLPRIIDASVLDFFSLVDSLLIS